MDCFIAGNGTKECIKECRKIASEYIGNVDTPEIYDGDLPSLITAVGHCHIDTCWLWPWAETKRKVARSWSNQCDLLDRYPELRFCASQAQQYKWLEMYYPSLFDDAEQIRIRLAQCDFQSAAGSAGDLRARLPAGAVRGPDSL